MQGNLRAAIAWILCCGGLLAAGCGLEENVPVATSRSTPANQVRHVAPRHAGFIKVASFNIQVFGTSKLHKTNVMQVLASVVRQFDVVAIQELRSKDPTVMDQFVRMINATGGHYRYEIGPRLGRTSSKEQYVYVYDATRIEVVPGSVYTVPDPDDLLHREPLVASFRVRGPPPERAFSFTLVNIHTDPDEVDMELAALDDVFRSVRQHGTEDDIILLGDLNADERHLGELGAVRNIMWAVSGATTNTRGTKSYDNILFDASSTVEYTGHWGVLDLMSQFQLTEQEALRVSDHLPVWAVFAAEENQHAGPLAARPTARE